MKQSFDLHLYYMLNKKKKFFMQQTFSDSIVANKDTFVKDF